MKTDKLQHVAFIMDGNRRWAKEKGLHTYEGHKKGLDRVKALMDYGKDTEIEVMTFYCFSTENWKRTKDEIGYLMTLFTSYIKKHLWEMTEKNIQIRHIGRKDRIPKKLLKVLSKAEEDSKNNTSLLVNLAIDYGGRDEIVRAVQKAQKEENEKITEEIIEKHLDTAPHTSVDLLIRTSGENRISNFLTWELAYSELFFEKSFFPDFSVELFQKIIENYSKRHRRFGT